MFSPRQVCSNQEGVSSSLQEVVQRHLQGIYKRPVAEHTRQAFTQAQQFIRSSSSSMNQSTDGVVGIVLDSGCGTGASTRWLAKRYPHATVIGVDKSAIRLDQAHPLPANALLVRADLQDFWRLAHQAQWKLQIHCLFYPNPWPKNKALMRRWHGHPVFPEMLALGGFLELRTNWDIYAQEFAMALSVAGLKPHLQSPWILEEEPVTQFERKYALAGQKLHRLQCDLTHYIDLHQKSI